MIETSSQGTFILTADLFSAAHWFPKTWRSSSGTRSTLSQERGGVDDRSVEVEGVCVGLAQFTIAYLHRLLQSEEDTKTGEWTKGDS